MQRFVQEGMARHAIKRENIRLPHRATIVDSKQKAEYF